MEDLSSLDYFNQSNPLSVTDFPKALRGHWETISHYGETEAELDSVFWATFYEFVSLAYQNQFRPPVSKWAITFSSLKFRNPGTLASTFHNCYSTLKANKKLQQESRTGDE